MDENTYRTMLRFDPYEHSSPWYAFKDSVPIGFVVVDPKSMTIANAVSLLESIVTSQNVSKSAGHLDVLVFVFLGDIVQTIPFPAAMPIDVAEKFAPELVAAMFTTEYLDEIEYNPRREITYLCQTLKEAHVNMRMSLAERIDLQHQNIDVSKH